MSWLPQTSTDDRCLASRGVAEILRRSYAPIAPDTQSMYSATSPVLGEQQSILLPPSRTSRSCFRPRRTPIAMYVLILLVDGHNPLAENHDVADSLSWVTGESWPSAPSSRPL
eukprot:CAMPEP_0176310736 /NCGR_PEP_ID=MMETSP0121_2-20121125/65760_1 /TAXON_ID=160619 /ORGANISM="Kryptoperidinium foliaceum, Strain CCMP 1326" /LENGTH=112 /DNA_ID=CAMNT_0017652703 /DNA_START=255 /DNA_END=591 /DNA_ORIENTATION=+